MRSAFRWRGLSEGGSRMTHRYTSSKRRGLTLMELLVLLALLLLLLGFLMAATFRARASAERVTSQNNLRQIVLAIHDCADTNNGNLPPGPVGWFPKKS